MGMNILLVEASSLYRDILQQALGNYEDVEIHLASDRTQAMAALEERKFQFFIISGQLPDGSGVDLARELRQSGLVMLEPIVLLTANASAQLAAEAGQAGVTELFRKQDLDELVRFLRHYLQVLQPMRCRILYVEDANDQRALLEAQLRAWGVSVDAFPSADEAWLAFERKPYDLVLCDVVLIGSMSGSRLINRIRRLPSPRGETPVLAVTAFDNPTRRIELFQLGVDDYVLKPVVEAELRVRIYNLVARKRAVERSQLLLSATSLGVVLVDVDGYVESLDDNAQSIFACDAGACVGKDIAALFADLRQEGAAALMHKLQQGELVNRTRQLALRSDGRKIPVEMTALMMRAGGDGRQFALLLRDTSEEDALAENLLRAKLAAEEAERMKSEFLANMSHEIRTPLNAIIGMAHLLMRAPLADEQLSHVNHINTAGEHLLGLISGVLDLSKIGAGKLDLEALPIDLQSLVQDVADIVAERAKAKGLTVCVEVASLPRGVIGDPLRLRQALLNYASNAVKFTERGRIVLRVERVLDLGDSYLLRFEVEDSGIGIPPAVREQLFAAFRQGDGSTTRRFGGTGLGLAITRELAGLMGGEVGVSSVPGEGSRFWFTARLTCSAEGVVGEANALMHDTLSLGEHFAGKRVLLVEDDPVNRQVAEAILEEFDFALDVAEDGQVAVDKVCEQEYDLILMDMLMPRMDGLQATQLIRAMPGRACVPVIALTANAFAEERQRCLDAGMNDFIAKPIRPDALFRMMGRYLRSPS
jgi:PAS domain S-box-containing protein